MSKARRLIESDEEDFKSEILGADINDLKRFILSGRVELTGTVTRNHHYVHQRSTNAAIDQIDLNFESAEQNEYWQETVEKDCDALAADLSEDVIEYNNAIYRELEAEYDYQNADEQVDDTIRANEYAFDEDGKRDDDGGHQIDELEGRSKERARDWYRHVSAGDNYFSEFIIEDWKARLEKKGFNSPEISYSGFSSQGDGASFTCKSIDFKLYLSDYDPLKPDGSEGEEGAAVAAGGGGPAA